MAIHCHNTLGLPKQTPALPPVRRDQLHDDISLALDAISNPRPDDRSLAEARSYLRHALRLIGGVA